MPSSDDGLAPLRKDARHNRELLIQAAREIFARRGVDAPLDDVARGAGVGNATLYRHFTGRADLLEAVFRDSLTALLHTARHARDEPDAWQALTSYLDHVFALLAADRGASDIITTGIQGVPTLDTFREDHRRTLDILLRRSRGQGAVRADLTVDELLFLLAALGRAVPAAPMSWRRHLTILLDGLRPLAVRPLPAPPLDPGRPDAECTTSALRHGRTPAVTDSPGQPRTSEKPIP
ncbi:helix-turn-helix domain-containing protein [Streptomyces sp. NPDC050732]|uniref:TetR/AcrR family transcriptional regulator n=1 Tax=Streptomyces sp. NPDC050732 TaxID=3154632 RepID=UPI00344241BD